MKYLTRTATIASSLGAALALLLVPLSPAGPSDASAAAADQLTQAATSENLQDDAVIDTPPSGSPTPDEDLPVGTPEGDGETPGGEPGPDPTDSEAGDESNPEEEDEEDDGAGEEEGDEEDDASLPSAPAPGTHRLAGKDRYQTAALISAQAYPNGAEVVIIASGSSFPDALSVSPLASKLNAPVLLVQKNKVPTSIQAELNRLDPSHVIVVGGTGAVSQAVANAASKKADKLTRLSGPTRYETSLAIAKYGWKDGANAAFIATGTNFADALAAGPAAGKSDAPLLLVPKKTSPTTNAVRAEVQRLQVQRLHVTGGTGAVSAAVLKSVAGGIPSSRYGGADRYETAALIIKAHFSSPVPAVYWASGQNYPDAVAAAGTAGALGAPLAISRQGCIPLSLRDAVDALQSPSRVVLGGTSILGQPVASNLACFAKAPTPTMSGKATIGTTLTAKTGTWSPAPTSLTYQWLRSGSAISGATASTYKLVKADVGKTITVRVTAKLDGFATTSKTSAKSSVITDPASINNASSINVVVNKKRPLNPRRYVPANLRMPVGIPNTNGQPLRAEAATALERMNVAGKNAGFRFYLFSGYRSYDTQARIYSGFVYSNGQTYADNYSAKAGHSEHQTGLAADIYESNSCQGSCFGGTRAGQWLRNNAYKYGFILRYDQGLQHIVGFAYEPWHFRYVGVDVATDMKKRGIRTLEQYYGLPYAPTY